MYLVCFFLQLISSPLFSLHCNGTSERRTGRTARYIVESGKSLRYTQYVDFCHNLRARQKWPKAISSRLVKASWNHHFWSVSHEPAGSLDLRIDHRLRVSLYRYILIVCQDSVVDSREPPKSPMMMGVREQKAISSTHLRKGPLVYVTM